MDTLARISLKPVGAWITPWQADSLLGALAVAWARSRGDDALKRDFLDPWQAAEPPFVLSDAFPDDALPAPANMPLMDWRDDQRKAVKKTRLLSESAFREVQAGRKPNLDGVDENGAASASIRDRVRMRNSVSRLTDSANEQDGLYEVRYSDLDGGDGARLTIYARASSAGVEILTEALATLGREGYGARATSGHGAFDIDGEPTPCPELDDVPNADAFVSLSTFQPARDDPTDGFWRAFVKYGKMAPDFHFAATFKRPQTMLEAGACFRVGGAPRPFYGGAVSTERLLSEGDRQRLAEIGVHPVQAAFALALPMVWTDGEPKTGAADC